MSASRLDMPDFARTLRGWFDAGDKPTQIHVKHHDTAGTIKRFRVHELEGRTPDEIAAKIVERAQADARAWKTASTYLIELYVGQGAQIAEETYAFSIEGRPAPQRRGGAAGGIISGDRDEVIADLVRQNSELHSALLRATGMVADWSETRATEDRAEIGGLRSERAMVWATLDQLRQIDREAQRADKEWERDQEFFKEGRELFSLVAGPIINRIVGFKAFPEKDSPLLSEFRDTFEELRKDVPTFDKLIEAVQGNEKVASRFITMFDKFLTDKDREQASAMLVESMKRKLLPKNAEAAE